jgi:hypothetical protein
MKAYIPDFIQLLEPGDRVTDNITMMMLDEGIKVTLFSIHLFAVQVLKVGKLDGNILSCLIVFGSTNEGKGSTADSGDVREPCLQEWIGRF